MTTHSAEWRLAKHVVSTRYEDLTEHTINCAKTFITDTLSVGIAGTAVPQAQQLLEALKSIDPGGPVAIWGANLGLSAPNAIMANAFNVHCQEYDCVHEGAVVHAMATLLPVLIAQAQSREGISGKELITAVVVGIDVACTLGLAANQAMQFFRPATAGGFGAVAGLAKLRGLALDQVIAAWGFQLAQASGTMQGHREGRPVLPLQVSFNARAAWQSCELAQTELQSLDNPISGECGYLAMFERDFTLEPLLDELGRVWRIDEFSHKPYPSGRATHAGVEGLLNMLREHKLATESIKSVVVTGPSLISRLVNRPPLLNPSPNYARLCMPYVLAKIMQHGHLEPKHYFDDELADPQTFELAQKVTMRVDDNPDPNAFTPVTIEVVLSNGQVFQTKIDNMLASPKRPLSQQQREEKFMQCCGLIDDHQRTGNKNLHELYANLTALDKVSDVHDLFK
ncbi:MmgE/PrpD family protein [Orrella daihaiensis]|uniref:MmgE/PrpD family protein n=1 Tax=Orrella daihaiensis TaxID=2782176 RepID=A0ABY4ANV8_9BURK|nr:MmgE/PrpD family protein [Orrella daihaiensis]UOD51080.1 MmgE/PrpD family protein [Orrella daihaiensis]